jgi:uncharacterized membrane protein YkvA (DUF1232 family)
MINNENTAEHHDFYMRLRRQVSTYLEKNYFKYADILLLAPDLFHLLVKLSTDKRVALDKKIKFLAVIAYFISPLDFLPEMILGAIGYLDDIALSAYILNKFINQTDAAIVREHWAGSQDILTVIKNILFTADSMIGSGLWRKIRRRFDAFQSN